MSYSTDDPDGFLLELSGENLFLQQFHRALMDRGPGLDWEFDASIYEPGILQMAQQQWSQRAIASYQATAQFAQFLYRLTHVGVPLDLIGATSRLATDKCRHAELCAKFSLLLGGDDILIPPQELGLYPDSSLVTGCAQTVLAICCFGQTLSIPVLQTLAVISTDPLAEDILSMIAGDEEIHARFGWETFDYFVDHLDEEQHNEIQETLPMLFQEFETKFFGSPEVLDKIAETEFSFEEDEDNLGTLSEEGYAAIFYSTVEETLFPALEQLSFDPKTAWAGRFNPNVP